MPASTVKVVREDGNVLFESNVNESAKVKLKSDKDDGITTHTITVSGDEPLDYAPPGTPTELSTAGQVSVAAGEVSAKDVPKTAIADPPADVQDPSARSTKATKANPTPKTTPKTAGEKKR